MPATMARCAFYSLLALVLSSFSSVYAQTLTPIDSVYINSGNPVYPFPQFLAYQGGTLGNLSTHSGVGVTHAEMEQAIRDAFRIDMNQSYYTGTTLNGVKYIKYRSSPDCSEGDGYGLLSAASMADKKTFDGMWLWIHDNAMHNVVSYSTGQAAPTYLYSTLPGWQNNTGSNSATDGDVDIALALFTAYKQWGELMGINDSKGNPISYKHDCIEFLKGLTDTLIYPASGNYLSGDIGLDGYIKGGDSWQEMTDWASDKTRSGLPRIPESRGPQQQYVDYIAPAYFHEFADFLSAENATQYAWNVNQFRRCESSSDWIMGQLLPNQRMIPSAGHVDITSANTATFTQMNEGEDFRLSWRTILNYVWHGNPASSWDPAAHQLKTATGNTYEHDVGARYAKFLWDTRQTPWSNACTKVPNASYQYWGPPVILNHYDVLGNPLGSFFLNWVPGTGSPSAVTSQDYALMAQLYRQCEMTWDAEIPNDGYLKSVPKYYHGWFRLLGMLILSGNYQPPSIFKPGANMKVYMAIDKTFGFDGDSVTYTIDYRNYGSQDAQNVSIVDTLHKDFIFLSATGNGVYNSANNTVTWSIGTVPGFKTATGIPPTKGQVTLKVKVGIPTQSQYRNRAIISCSNGTGWTSNEYPNHITTVMERNYLDIAKRALVVHTSATPSAPKPGTDVQITITFANSSDAGWINGGRPGVHFAYAIDANTASGASKVMRFRLFHDADEAYIDYGNYRFSYFIYDSLRKCYQGTAGCTLGWQVTPYVTEGLDKTYIKIFQENIMPGQDSIGKWNQRIVVQFSDPTNPNRVINLAATDCLLQQDYGNIGINIHRGGGSPLRLIWDLHTDYNNPVSVWNDDWSWDANAVDAEGGMYWPITSDWTDLDNPNVPVTRWNPKSCSDATHKVTNALVEEWDGYTWRRVAGNGPLPGRDVNNVVIRDTIPAGLTFNSFVGAPPFGIAPTINGNVVTWSISKLQIKQSGSIVYTAKASSSCPNKSKNLVNRAWISADKESPVSDSAAVALSCDSNVVVFTKSTLSVLDASLLPLNDTVKIDTTVFNVSVTDKDRDVNQHAKDTVSVKIKNPSSGDSLVVTLYETGDSTGIFRTASTVPIVHVKTGANQISMADGDKIWITYADPYDSTDVSQAILVSKATFPVATRGWLLDTNGDGTVDKAVVAYDKVLTSPPDSITVYFPDATTAWTVKAGQGSITASGAFATLAFGAAFPPKTTSFSNGTLGTGISYLNTGGEVKKSVFPLADSVGPVILTAQVAERLAPGIDTLFVTFSEALQPASLAGTTLLLIKNNVSSVLTITSVKALSTGYALALATGMPAPQQGDSLRINPSGPLVDLSKNKAHPLNPPVMIGVKAKSASIVKGYYFDRNADGAVETVEIDFNKKVSLSDCIFSLQWAIANSAIPSTVNSIDAARLSYKNSDSSIVEINVAALFPGVVGPKTSGGMQATVAFVTFPGQTSTAEVADSAAPVIVGATYIMAANAGSAGNLGDTLDVDFSEPVQVPPDASPFLLSGKENNTAYSFTLAPLSTQPSATIRFNVKSVDGVIEPLSGDSIWIDSNKVADNAGGVYQINPKNKKAALQVKQSGQWKIMVLINPFSPGTPFSIAGLSGIGTAIKIVPTRTISDLSDISIQAKIYDALGNLVFESSSPKNNAGDNSFNFIWDGRNKNNRVVASNTYLAHITVTTGGVKTLVQKLKIGVRR